MVSVIVPNYNHGTFLQQRITTILKQTYQDFELLLLDDNSPDKSLEIIYKYAEHPKVSQIIVNEVNSGSSISQWKKGIQAASGEYIWIAESDDYAAPDLLENLVPLLESDDAIALAYAQSKQVDEKGDIIKNMIEEVRNISDRWERPFVNDGIDELKNYFCLINTIPNASGVVFRKSVAIEFIEEMNTFRNFKLVGDKMFWTNMLLRGKVAFCPKPLNYFRKHTNNVRSQSSSKQNLIDNFKWYAYLRSKVDIPKSRHIMVRNRLFGWWFGLGANPANYFYANNCELRKESSSVFPFNGWLFFYLFLRFRISALLNIFS